MARKRLLAFKGYIELVSVLDTGSRLSLVVKVFCHTFLFPFNAFW